MGDKVSPETVGNLGTGLQIGGVINQTIGAYRKSSADASAYEYQSKIASNNALVAEWQASDALNRGQLTQNKVMQRTAQVRGSQEASFAARGIDLGTGSPLNIITDTQFTGDIDAATAGYNAQTEAWGLREKARNYSANAAVLKSRADTENPEGAAWSTLLTGAGTVASGWYSRNKVNATPQMVGV